MAGEKIVSATFILQHDLMKNLLEEDFIKEDKIKEFEQEMQYALKQAKLFKEKSKL